MTKAQLITAVSEKVSISTKEAEAIISSVENVILDSLVDGEDVPFLDGKFKIQPVKAKPEKQGRNPKTGEAITISAKPATRKVVFKPGKKLKESFQ